MKKRRMKGLYLILDQQYTRRDIVSIAVEAVEAGVDIIQYREKILTGRDALAVAKRLRAITEKAGVLFIVNDDPALALAAGADGVHLGQEDLSVDVARKIIGKDKVIGISTHTDQEVLAANNLDVNYIGFGPIFHSSTKTVATPHGIDGIKRVRGLVSVPMIAIGGITHENASDVMIAGAEGVAVLSAILSAPDIKKVVCGFKERIKVSQSSL